nr:methyl-accepting chemotaxis protein [uncultured Holophaga sp.]
MFQRWFQNLSVRRKISLVTAAISLVMLISLGITLLGVRAAMQRTHAINQEDLLPTADLTVMRTSSLRAMNLLYKHMRATSSQEMAAVEAEIVKVDTAADEAWSRYEKSLVTPLQKELAPGYRAASLEQRRIRNELVIPASRAHNLELANRILREQLDPTDARLGPPGGKLVKDAEVHAAGSLDTGQAEARRGMVLAIVIFVAGITILVFLGWMLIKGVDEPLQACSQVLGQLSEGDLRVRTALDKRRDEFGDLGRALNATAEKLRSLIHDVQVGVEGMASGSTQLSASADEMASTAGEIAHVAESMRTGSERMAAAVTELSASIEGVNQGTQASLERLDETVQATLHGEASGTTTQQAMGEISTTARHISDAVGVIREIANQTNLLSLNAAIEAAKAGEHGRGFSVVAEEVRKLAERSGSSAKEIDTLLLAATAAVDRGEHTVSSTVEILKNIRTSLDEFSGHVRSMAAAAMEQASAGSEVARQVETSAHESATVASAIIQMSASTGEVARTASELHQLSERLQDQVRQFRL